MKGERPLKPSVNSIEVRDQLVLENQGLIRFVWQRLERIHPGVRSLGIEDAISAGQLGLLRAAELFDFTRNEVFSTYAVAWIKQAMKHAYYSNMLIRVPDRPDPEDEERVEKKKQATKIVPFSSLINDKFRFDPGHIPVKENEEERLPDDWLKVVEKMALLQPRDRTILEMRFFQNQPYVVIARHFNFSKESARQTILRALRILRTHLEGATT